MLDGRCRRIRCVSSRHSGTPGAAWPAAQVEPLHDELRNLIAASRQRLAATVNAELTQLYWRIGQRLSGEFGCGFQAKNPSRMVPFAQAFPDVEIVASLMRQFSWSHFL